jgi:hypothetical protein
VGVRLICLLVGMLMVSKSALAQLGVMGGYDPDPRPTKEKFETFWNQKFCAQLGNLAGKSSEELRTLAQYQSRKFKDKEFGKPLKFQAEGGMSPSGGGFYGGMQPAGSQSTGYGGADEFTLAVILNILGSDNGTAKTILKKAFKQCHMDVSGRKFLIAQECEFYQLAAMDMDGFKKFLLSKKATIDKLENVKAKQAALLEAVQEHQAAVTNPARDLVFREEPFIQKINSKAKDVHELYNGCTGIKVPFTPLKTMMGGSVPVRRGSSAIQ